MARPRNPLLEQASARRGRRTVYTSRPHDVQNIYVSLKQWRILHAVIDCGGFAEAAKYLHLSQSAISYTVAKLQEQLNIPILKIEGRKATLTAAGRALLERSRHVLKEAVELELFAKNLKQGWGTEVRLVVDHNFPSQTLMRALHKFEELGQGVHVRLNEVAMPRAEEVLRDRAVDLAISTHVPMGFLGEPLVEVEYIAVAHPDHPLLKLERDVTLADLEREIQIGISHLNDAVTTGADSVGYMHRWNMSSFDTAVEGVCECFGYAWLPKHRVEPWLDKGELMPLPLNDGGGYKVVLYLIHGRHWPANPAAGRLAEVLRGVAAAESSDECEYHGAKPQ